MTTDPVTAAEALIAAATNATGEERGYFLALARMAIVAADVALERQKRTLAAIAAEEIRAAKVARELGTG